jgi:hypothetical protein
MSTSTIAAPSNGSSNISKRKLASNRANAQKSTGPRTPAGKAKSALNALTHGLRSRLSTQTLVPQDEQENFQTLSTALEQELCPETPLQQLLFDRIALLFWKLRRTAAAEANLLDNHNAFPRINADKENARTQKRHAQLLARHQSDPGNHPQPNEPTLRPLPTAAEALAHYAKSHPKDNPWLTLHRYDQATQRELHKTLKQYLALQQDHAQDNDDDADLDPLPAPAPNEPTDSADHAPSREPASSPQSDSPLAGPNQPTADPRNPPATQQGNQPQNRKALYRACAPNPFILASLSHPSKMPDV